jgi:hypothetical protein
MELPIALTIKSCPQIRNEDLGSFQKSDLFTLKPSFIPEAGKTVGKDID